MSDADFEKSVEELAKNKLQKPKKLSTYAARWLPEVMLARECWDRVEREVVELRKLRRADVIAFVDAEMMPTAGGSCRQLCVHVKGAAELARSGPVGQDGAANGVGAADGAQGGVPKEGCAACEPPNEEAGDMVVPAEGLAAFRIGQQLWPAARQCW